MQALEMEHLRNAERINMAILQRWLLGMGVKPVTWSTLVDVLRTIEIYYCSSLQTLFQSVCVCNCNGSVLY